MSSNVEQCSCEGTNSDCFRCNGTGLIQPRDKKSLYSKAYAIGQLLISKPKKPEKTFPVFSKTIKPIKKTAIKVANKPKKPIKKVSIKIIKKPDIPVTCIRVIECPICRIYISRTELAFFNHLKTHDTSDKIKHKKLLGRTFELIKIMPPDNQLFDFKQDKRIYAHTNQANNSKIHMPAIAVPSTYKVKPTTKPDSSNLVSREDVSKKIDKTYGHHTIRELGRFGSHPSHDNFDDESGA